MIPASYSVSVCNRWIPSLDDSKVPDGLVWGEWRGSDRKAVIKAIESDWRVFAGRTWIMNSICGHPSEKCNRGVFCAFYKGHSREEDAAFDLSGPDIPW